MSKTKGKPFLEIFASAVQEDYRFPLLELFAFLYALGTFALASMSFVGQNFGEEQAVFNLASSLMGLPLFIFVILVFKNVAYGLGNDLEKGTIQTILSYPLKRHAILTAKLLSAIGIALLLLFGIQVLALSILAPAMILPFMHVVILTYLANLSLALLTTSIILLVTLLIRKGGLAIALGIIIYFAISIIESLALFLALVNRSPLVLQALSVLNPALAMQYYYSNLSFLGETIWAPSFAEVVSYVGAGYFIIAVVLSLSYYLFSRRLSL